VPANTTSSGSSPTRSVARTWKVFRLTIETSSDRLLTTQASLSDSAASDTGSIPTGISATRVDGLGAEPAVTGSCGDPGARHEAASGDHDP